ARRSQRVLVDSLSTRDDLITLTGVGADRIDVVPLGLGALQRGAALGEREVRSRFELGERRVALSLSAKRPHKNLLALIGALARIPAERRPLLVAPGYPTWHEAELRRRVHELGVERDVRLEGWLDAAEIEGLWRVADLFV